MREEIRKEEFLGMETMNVNGAATECLVSEDAATEDAESMAVFAEEKAKLEETKIMIQEEHDRELAAGKQINAAAHKMVVVERRDLEEKQDCLANGYEKLNRADFLQELKQNPYFARVDVKWERTGKEDTVYVGDELYIHKPSNDVIVVAWYSDIGSLTSQSNRIRKVIGGEPCQVEIRRRFHIKNGELECCETEFDNQEGNDIVDPFLIRVLKDLRREHRMTKIIETIQGDQNEIVRKPLKTPFILQGCAGSGKTSVLLHRLSLLMNKHHPDNAENNGLVVEPTDFLMLAPNRAFVHELDKLCEDLGISDIRREAIEDYFISAIESFFVKPDKKTKGEMDRNGQKKAKSEEVVEAPKKLKVVSESEVKREILKVLYSTEFFEKFQTAYTDYWNKVITQIQALNVNELAERMGEEGFDFTEGSIFSTRNQMAYRAIQGRAENLKDRFEHNVNYFQQLPRLISEDREKLKKVTPYYYEKAKAKLDAKISAYERIKAMNLTQDDYEMLTKLQEVIDEFSYEVVEHEVMDKEIKDVFDSFGETLEHKIKIETVDVYRFELYLKLLLCVLYFKGGIVNNFSYAYIDEAQDISVPEYRTLQMLWGDKVTVNLFGDTEQLVYDYKGIQSWDEVSGLFGSEMCHLSQDFRNTSQITDFCNKEFAMDVYPIGIAGDDVEKLELQDAIDKLCELPMDEPNYRKAIIYDGREETKEALRERTAGLPVTWRKPKEGFIRILSVEQAKGMEFEAVVALTENMSKKEKYVADTRALEKLIVVEKVA